MLCGNTYCISICSVSAGLLLAVEQQTNFKQVDANKQAYVFKINDLWRGWLNDFKEK